MEERTRTEVITFPYKTKEYYSFKLNLVESDLEDLVTIAASANLTPEELLESFVSDLCAGVGGFPSQDVYTAGLWKWLESVFMFAGKKNSFVRYALENDSPLNIYSCLRLLESSFIRLKGQDTREKSEQELKEDIRDMVESLLESYLEYEASVPEAVGFRAAMEEILACGNRVYRITESMETIRISNELWERIYELEEFRGLKKEGKL